MLVASQTQLGTLSFQQNRALHIVRSVLKPFIDPNRIVFGNTKSYFSILFDGDRYKPICRIYFEKHLSIGIITTRKVESRTALFKLNDIEKYQSDLVEVVVYYMEKTC